MSSGLKCKNCGSADVEVDSARGDAVCTNCGSVLEDNIIVSEVQFEEAAHGAASAVGQFVSSDTKGGATGYGKFHVGIGAEAKEVTLRKARLGITHLSQQLRLNNRCIETAFNFFRMALGLNLTRGRRNTHIYAACVYLSCRTEGTTHLLIDISDILQICCYELGRTYLKVSHALQITIPSIDPCLYVMRFANKLEFLDGTKDKTQDVVNTAQRILQRMIKDSIHSGRRPSGLCGAAILIAARMHDFSRTPMDIVRIVKIHESTLRKRLIEFGDTPSSMLTLDEFMAVDLEAEQDPPAFKLARRRDKERLQRLSEHAAEFTDLQREIDMHLDKELRVRKRKPNRDDDKIIDVEINETNVFISESTVEAINECLVDDPDPEAIGTTTAAKKNTVINKIENDVADDDDDANADDDDDDVDNDFDSNDKNKENTENMGLRPDIAAMCIVNTTVNSKQFMDNTETSEMNATDDAELDFSDLNDDELNGYIMSENEAKFKDEMWKKLNADYLKEAKEKEERLAKEREEGKPEKKKRRVSRKKCIGPSNTPGEAIEKMLQEKKISNKINYDILKTLTLSKENEDDGGGATVAGDSDATIAGCSIVNKKEEIDLDDNDVNLDRKFSNSFLFGKSKIREETSPNAGTKRKPIVKVNTSAISSSLFGKESKIIPMGLPIGEIEAIDDNKAIIDKNPVLEEENELDDEDFDDEKVDFDKSMEDNTEKSLADLLNVNANNNDDYYGYDEDEDY